MTLLTRTGLTVRTGGALLGLLLALGLPWGVVGSETEYVPGFYVPGSCTIDSDGWMWCTPSYSSSGWLAPGPGAPITGYMSSARVFLVAAVLVLGWAALRGSEPRLALATGLVVAAVLITGTALRTGALAAVLAAALLVLELRARRRATPAPAPPAGGVPPP